MESSSLQPQCLRERERGWCATVRGRAAPHPGLLIDGGYAAEERRKYAQRIASSHRAPCDASCECVTCKLARAGGPPSSARRLSSSAIAAELEVMSRSPSRSPVPQPHRRDMSPNPHARGRRPSPYSHIAAAAAVSARPASSRGDSPSSFERYVIRERERDLPAGPEPADAVPDRDPRTARHAGMLSPSRSGSADAPAPSQHASTATSATAPASVAAAGTQAPPPSRGRTAVAGGGLTSRSLSSMLAGGGGSRRGVAPVRMHSAHAPTPGGGAAMLQRRVPSPHVLSGRTSRVSGTAPSASAATSHRRVSSPVPPARPGRPLSQGPPPQRPPSPQAVPAAQPRSRPQALQSSGPAAYALSRPHGAASRASANAPSATGAGVAAAAAGPPPAKAVDPVFASDAPTTASAAALDDADSGTPPPTPAVARPRPFLSPNRSRPVKAVAAPAAPTTTLAASSENSERFVQHAEAGAGAVGGGEAAVPPVVATTESGDSCEIRYPNGDVYHGQVADGEREGHGTLFYARGGSLTVWWSRGIPNGYGERRWADGSNFQGMFSDSAPDGQGRMAYADKAVYHGNWVRGQRHGQGELLSATNELTIGVWEHDMLVNTLYKIDCDGYAWVVSGDGTRAPATTAVFSKILASQGREVLLPPGGVENVRAPSTASTRQSQLQLQPNPWELLNGTTGTAAPRSDASSNAAAGAPPAVAPSSASAPPSPAPHVFQSEASAAAAAAATSHPPSRHAHPHTGSPPPTPNVSMNPSHTHPTALSVSAVSALDRSEASVSAGVSAPVSASASASAMPPHTAGTASTTNPTSAAGSATSQAVRTSAPASASAPYPAHPPQTASWQRSGAAGGGVGGGVVDDEFEELSPGVDASASADDAIAECAQKLEHLEETLETQMRELESMGASPATSRVGSTREVLPGASVQSVPLRSVSDVDHDVDVADADAHAPRHTRVPQNSPATGSSAVRAHGDASAAPMLPRVSSVGSIGGPVPSALPPGLGGAPRAAPDAFLSGVGGASAVSVASQAAPSQHSRMSDATGAGAPLTTGERRISPMRTRRSGPADMVRLVADGTDVRTLHRHTPQQARVRGTPAATPTPSAPAPVTTYPPEVLSPRAAAQAEGLDAAQAAGAPSERRGSGSLSASPARTHSPSYGRRSPNVGVINEHEEGLLEPAAELILGDAAMAFDPTSEPSYPKDHVSAGAPPSRFPSSQGRGAPAAVDADGDAQYDARPSHTHSYATHCHSHHSLASDASGGVRRRPSSETGAVSRRSGGWAPASSMSAAAYDYEEARDGAANAAAARQLRSQVSAAGGSAGGGAVRDHPVAVEEEGAYCDASRAGPRIVDDMDLTTPPSESPAEAASPVGEPTPPSWTPQSQDAELRQRQAFMANYEKAMGYVGSNAHDRGHANEENRTAHDAANDRNAAPAAPAALRGVPPLAYGGRERDAAGGDESFEDYAAAVLAGRQPGTSETTDDLGASPSAAARFGSTALHGPRPTPDSSSPRRHASQSPYAAGAAGPGRPRPQAQQAPLRQAAAPSTPPRLEQCARCKEHCLTHWQQRCPRCGTRALAQGIYVDANNSPIINENLFTC